MLNLCSQLLAPKTDITQSYAKLLKCFRCINLSKYLYLLVIIKQTTLLRLECQEPRNDAFM